MTRFQEYQNLLKSIQPQFASIEEGKLQPIDAAIGYFAFAVLSNGWYSRYRLSKDGAGAIVVNKDNPIACRDIETARSLAIIELGERALAKLQPIEEMTRAEITALEFE